MDDPVRCFVALPLPDDVRRELAGLAGSLRDEAWAREVRWVGPESLHLTLRFLGDVEASALADVEAAVDRCAAGRGRLRLTPSAVTGLPSGSRARVLVAKLEDEPALAALAADLEEAAVALGHAPERRRFRPHVTLGRVRRPPLRARVGAPLTLPPFEVDEVHVMRSRLDRSGARYETIHRARLDGDASSPKAGPDPAAPSEKGAP